MNKLGLKKKQLFFSLFFCDSKKAVFFSTSFIAFARFSFPANNDAPAMILAKSNIEYNFLYSNRLLLQTIYLK